jgi:hypothetical protein
MSKNTPKEHNGKRSYRNVTRIVKIPRIRCPHCGSLGDQKFAFGHPVDKGPQPDSDFDQVIHRYLLCADADCRRRFRLIQDPTLKVVENLEEGLENDDLEE